MILFLFLDLDGVLRRRSSPLYGLDRDLVANLEGVLRALPGVQVVITSSWREAFSLAELRKHFSADIARRIVGVTPSSKRRDGFYPAVRPCRDVALDSGRFEAGRLGARSMR